MTLNRAGAGLSALALSLVLAGCGDTDADGDGSEAAGPAGLLEPGTLTICNSSSNYPPMYMVQNDKLVGFDPDMARAVAELWEVTSEFNRMSFDGLIPALDAGRCDVLWSALFMSEERLAVADAVPYMETGPALIVAGGNPEGIAGVDDLAGKTVAVQRASGQEDILHALDEELRAAGKPAIDIQTYPEVSATVAAVLNGKADAFIETDVSAANIVNEREGQLEMVPDALPASTRFGVYVPKHSELLEPLTEAVDQLVQDGTLQELAEKYGLDPEKVQGP